MRSFVLAGRLSEPSRSRSTLTVYKIVLQSPTRGIGCYGIGLTKFTVSSPPSSYASPNGDQAPLYYSNALNYLDEAADSFYDGSNAQRLCPSDGWTVWTLSDAGDNVSVQTHHLTITCHGLESDVVRITI